MHVLPNGFDPQLLGRRRPPAEREGPRTFVFAGSLYGEHTAAAIVQALALPAVRGTRPAAVVGVVDQRTRTAITSTPRPTSPSSRRSAGTTPIERVLDADAAVAITTPATGGDMALPMKTFRGTRPRAPGAGAGEGRQRYGATARTARPGRRSGPLAGDVDGSRQRSKTFLEAPPTPVEPEALSDFDRDRIAERYAELLDDVATRSSSRTVAGTTTSAR